MRGADTGRPAAMALRLRQSSEPGAGARGWAAAKSTRARRRCGATARRWRWRSAGVSLGEGWTPLVERRWDGAPVLFKLESQMPTGSFKDRGSAVMLNHLIEVGVGARSTRISRAMPAPRSRPTPPRPGFAAASTSRRRAARQDRADRRLRRRAARDSRHPPGRDRSGAARRQRSFYASHNWQPFFIEGTKTLAYELWEQLGFRVPDNILVPTGYGSNILGLDRGFDELERNGEIDRRPRLFAVQAANCAAFAAAWAPAPKTTSRSRRADRRRRHRHGKAGPHARGAGRYAPFGRRCRGGRRSRYRPGAQGIRPARPVCRPTAATAAAAFRDFYATARSARTRPLSPS